MSVIERFLETLDKAGITPYMIECKFGVKSAQSKISQLSNPVTKGGKEKTISSDMLSALCENDDRINIDYILAGKGQPLKDSVALSKRVDDISIDPDMINFYEDIIKRKDEEILKLQGEVYRLMIEIKKVSKGA